MPRLDPSRKRLALALAGGGFAAVVLVVATAFSCTRTEPGLDAAAFRPTTTTTTTTTTAAEDAAGAPVTLPTGSTAPTTTTAAPSSTGEGSESAPDSTGPPATSLQALPARTSQVATVRAGGGDVTVFADATGDETTATVPAAGDYGQPQVFLVLEEQGDRLRVLLPVRPNGSKGWIDAGAVDVASHDYQIQVSLSEFRMVVQRGSEVVIDTAIGVGTQDTPTVGGEFYTWVLIDPTNAGYGSYAYGLSGFSTLEQFAGGDGRMGIHGTTDDSSIGRNVSHGCVRVPDDVVVDLVEDVGLPLGVPVQVLG